MPKGSPAFLRKGLWGRTRYPRRVFCLCWTSWTDAPGSRVNGPSGSAPCCKQSHGLKCYAFGIVFMVKFFPRSLSSFIIWDTVLEAHQLGSPVNFRHSPVSAPPEGWVTSSHPRAGFRVGFTDMNSAHRDPPWSRYLTSEAVSWGCHLNFWDRAFSFCLELADLARLAIQQALRILLLAASGVDYSRL